MTNSLRASAMIAATLGASLLLGVLFFYSSFASAQVGTAAAPGTTIVVNTEEDELNTDGDCSLREAIQAANPPNAPVDGCAGGSATERDAIHFALGKEATITLGSQLSITDDAGLTINGQKKKITVSGDDSVRVFLVTSGAKLNLNYLTVADGKANGNGGGIANDGGEVRVINSTFSGNSAGSGGAIENTGNGTLTVTNSTFSGNSAGSGGAVRNIEGNMTVTNSTFSGNSATQGGGIDNHEPLTVTNSTFSENSALQGANIFNASGETATLKNTIVANPTQGENCSNLGTLTDGGYNIEDGTSCDFSEANNSKPDTDPLLDPNGLANNSGPTQTIALLMGSPAINAIPRAENGCGTEVTTDQRGVSRPQGSGCEVGAFEKKVRRR